MMARRSPTSWSPTPTATTPPGCPSWWPAPAPTTYGYGPHGPVPEHDPTRCTVSFDEYFTEEEKDAFEKAWKDTPDELKREGPDVDFHPRRRRW